jgi:hypothetical protein
LPFSVVALVADLAISPLHNFVDGHAVSRPRAKEEMMSSKVDAVEIVEAVVNAVHPQKCEFDCDRQRQTQMWTRRRNHQPRTMSSAD